MHVFEKAKQKNWESTQRFIIRTLLRVFHLSVYVCVSVCVCVLVCVCERERNRQKDIDREKQKKRETEKERQRQCRHTCIEQRVTENVSLHFPPLFGKASFLFTTGFSRLAGCLPYSQSTASASNSQWGSVGTTDTCAATPCFFMTLILEILTWVIRFEG